MEKVELRVFSITVKNPDLSKKLKSILFTYNQFENTLLKLILKNYNLYKEDKDTNDFNLLTSPQLIIDTLYNNKNGLSTQVKYLKKKYKKNELWLTLEGIAKKLNPNNLVYVINEVKTNFDIYFKNLDNNKQDKNLFDGVYAVELDKQNSLSFARLEKDNLIGIRLSNGLVYINVNKEEMKNLMDIDKVHSVKVVYDDGNLYLHVIYLKKVTKTENRQTKQAIIDIDGNNLMSIFVDDETTPSIIIDGKPFKIYNRKFDKLIDKLNESNSKEAAKMITLEKYRFFEEEFSKMAKYVIEYLHIHDVTDLLVFKNSTKSKNNQILITELLMNIESQVQEYGININYSEADTDKNFEWLKDKLFKLCNPIKIKSDYEFCRLLKGLQNSGLGKSASFIGAETSQSNRLVENASFC